MRSLLITIHDVSPRHEARIDRLIDGLHAAGVGTRFGMLVVPDFWGESPLAKAPAFQAKLRAWAASGVEMWLHGFYHKDLTAHDAGGAALKARLLTAGEGEFLGLDARESRRRLNEGRALLEDILGTPIPRFVAPAWLYSDASKAALTDLGFTLAEDHFRVWNPSSNRILTKGPVISYASRTPVRMASSLFFSRLATAALPLQKIIRLALHPHDVDKQPLITETARALKSLTRTHTPATYTAALPSLPRSKERESKTTRSVSS
ncbi:DUF2334 domain-containing protein [Sandaracinobacteroides saxicola]|uniref:Polysaccharide deacetylase family protein n=1 Tax=Sandaracinobacteroides saxicola TaxID=2759707 RepID=A0A7G5IIZ0_9SPHN|nr:polysaccharide deacetylase family protein [Sandaracinobacteroides saxicola]QMW23332.1 polysaccharide deacetylase family protein [Sandaracinobacteroides saxicola]